MELQKIKVHIVGLFLLFCCIFFVQKTVNGYYACGGYCGYNPGGCAPGAVCAGASVCGTYYNTCSGATCNANTGWDQTTCNTPNQCNNAGTTRTASFGACTVTCGVGTKTCNCLAQNNCPITCTGGVACGVTTTACCIPQAPQVAPAVSSVGTGTCSKSNPMTVNWTFTDTGSNCNLSWGFACSAGNTQANVNTFTIKVDGVVNTTGLASTARTAIISTAVAASHQIQVCAENGFAENCSASFTVTIDNTAPPKPSDSMQYVQDPTCLGKFTAKYSWTAVTDTGCAGLNADPYWAQGSSSSAVNPDGGFQSILYNWDLNGGNTWGAVLTRSSAQSYPPGTQLYFHVQSRDALDNQSGWTPTTVGAVVPTPSPFPAIHVEGPLIEDISNTCYSGMTIDPNSLTLQPVINPAPGVTANCTKTAVKYSCDFTINNQTGLCYGNSIQVQLGGTYPGYGTIGWRAGGACSGAISSLTLTPGDPPQMAVPLFLSYGGGSDPTDGNWFKISNSSFNSRKTGRVDVVPNTYITYDSDDVMSSNIMINSSGVLVQNSPVTIRAGSTTYSTNNWYTSGYQYDNDVSYQKYVDYLKARKDYTTITSLSEITGDGIYSITAPVTLTSTQFDGKKVVLVVEGIGATTFGSNFIPTGGSVAVLGKDIVIGDSVTEVDAIVVGEVVSTGVSTSGLKIKGNLIDESAIEIERTQSDARKPSLFVVFDAKTYLDVLPYLSTSTYDWRQIQ
jgi:hypothetical protein